MQARTAFWRYGRTMALASLGRVKAAEAEFVEFQTACDAVPDSRLLGNNPAKVVLQIGLPLAEGELEYRKKHYDRAFELLRLAVQRDDSLHYDEPWGWMMPARHALGALLLEQGRLSEAEVVYREDLRQHPDNGWALKGLAEALRRTNREAEARIMDKKFDAAWANSDIKINASCFCRRGSRI
jgi:tetratricopeptide (TPR) repeat protein